MTERSRSALYTGLSSVVDEEAVQEMLSFFPARDVEEPVTKEFLRAELAGLERRISENLRRDLRAEFHGEIAGVRTEIGGLREELHSEIAGVRTEIGGLREELHSEVTGVRTEIGGLREELHSEIAGVRTGIGGLREELHSEVTGVRTEIGGLRSEFRDEIRRMVWINIGSLVAFAGMIIAAVRL